MTISERIEKNYFIGIGERGVNIISYLISGIASHDKKYDCRHFYLISLSSQEQNVIEEQIGNIIPPEQIINVELEESGIWSNNDVNFSLFEKEIWNSVKNWLDLELKEKSEEAKTE